MKELNLFKLEYSWYEGEYNNIVLATTKKKEEIEKDLKEANKKTKIKEGVDCLPTKYNLIINFLERRGYIICNFIKDQIYSVDDDVVRKKKNTYKIENKESKITWRILS